MIEGHSMHMIQRILCFGPFFELNDRARAVPVFYEMDVHYLAPNRTHLPQMSFFHIGTQTRNHNLTRLSPFFFHFIYYFSRCILPWLFSDFFTLLSTFIVMK